MELDDGGHAVGEGELRSDEESHAPIVAKRIRANAARQGEGLGAQTESGVAMDLQVRAEHGGERSGQEGAEPSAVGENQGGVDATG